MAVSPGTFAEQIGRIAEKGWRTIGTSELLAFVQTGKAPRKKSFLVTFDDGYFDNWHYAAPVLAKHGMKAVVFMVAE